MCGDAEDISREATLLPPSGHGSFFLHWKFYVIY